MPWQPSFLYPYSVPVVSFSHSPKTGGGSTAIRLVSDWTEDFRRQKLLSRIHAESLVSSYVQYPKVLLLLLLLFRSNTNFQGNNDTAGHTEEMETAREDDGRASKASKSIPQQLEVEGNPEINPYHHLAYSTHTNLEKLTVAMSISKAAKLTHGKS